jgi:hypothetical protein
MTISTQASERALRRKQKTDDTGPVIIHWIVRNAEEATLRGGRSLSGWCAE